MNFLLGEMTYLRYFMPLIIEGNKRNIKSNLFYKENTKYSNPVACLNYLKKLSIEHNFNLLHMKEINKHPSDVTFFLEGQCVEYVKYKTKKITLTSNVDFEHHYDGYIQQMDHVVFISKYYAKKYNKLSEKNIYGACTKYDSITSSIEEIKKKYNLKDKNVLIMYPYGPWVKGIDLTKIYKILKKLNYNIVVKTRGKNPAQSNFKGDRYIVDKCWFPHDSLELIKACDFVIGFDSSTLEECIILNRFEINFKAGPKGYRKVSELYDTKCCIDLERNEVDKLEESIKQIKVEKEVFEQVRKKFLFENDFKSSERILDLIKE